VLAKPKRKRRTKAEIDAEKASRAAMAAMSKAAGGAKIKPIQPNIPAAPTVGQATSMPGTIGVADTEKSQTSQSSTSNVIDMFSKVPDKLERLAAESITEADAIPLKSVVQGYSVEYNPRTRQVTVSRGGQVIGSAINKSGNPKYHSSIVTKIIDRAEEDKYPTDIDVRDVALPMKRVAEGSVFGQQDFDTQMDLAKLKSQLTQPKPAQSAPASAEPQPVPARLSDLQAKRQRVANLADIKKDIETLQARATRGGRMLPRGLAADLEDYFTTTDIDTAYDDMMSKYQRQLGALQQYLGMRKALWSPKKDVHEMKAKELEESLRRGESYSAKVYFKDGTSATVTGIPSIETDVKSYFAKKGKPVERVEFDFAPQGGGRGSGPEPHEPGSGSAVSGRTGDPLPEANEISVTGQPVEQEKGYYSIWAKKGDRWSPVTKYSDRKEAEEIKRGLEKRGMEVIIREGEGSWKKETPWTKTTGKDPRGEVTHMSDVARRETEKMAKDSSPMGQLFKDFEKIFGKKPPVKEGDVVNINRGGHNAFRDKNDWLDKRDYVQQQLLDPRQRDNYPELKQRLLDINSAGRKLGYSK
jgi:hypothetical protein